MSSVAPDYRESDDPEAAHYELLVPPRADSGNTLRILNRLQNVGYEVSKEVVTDHQVVYNVYPKPDRDVPSNRLPPAMRGSADD